MSLSLTAVADDVSASNYSHLPHLDGRATVELDVNGGKIIIEVNGDEAPLTSGNFVELVNNGFYNNLVFHRVIDDFVAQGGDPQSHDPGFPVDRLGTGGYIDSSTQQERTIPLEIRPNNANVPIYGQTLEQAGVTSRPVLSHSRGAVAMARSQLPDSASSQFYIALEDLPFLDGNYAVFGYVKEGMDVVDDIRQGDRITTATVIDGIDNLNVPLSTRDEGRGIR